MTEARTDQVSESLEKSSDRKSDLSKWKSIAGISTVAMVVFAYLFFSGGSIGQGVNVITQDEASMKLAELVNKSSGGSEQYVFTSIEEKYGLYFLKFDVETANGPIEQEAYISRDGELLVLQASLYQDIIDQIELAQQQQNQVVPVEDVEAFQEDVPAIEDSSVE